MKTFNRFDLKNGTSILLVLVFLCISTAIWSKQQVIKTPEQCTTIKSSLKRLTCFDHYFKTPIVIENKKQVSQVLRNRTSKIMQMAMRVEQQRTDEQTGFLSDEMLEHELAGQQRIILTTPAIGSSPPRPLLIISCINNITRLQIGLHQPINKGWIEISLGLNGGKQQTNSAWRMTGDGQIVDAGRGIPSINLLKTMQGQNRVQIHSQDISLQGLTFDITGFTQQVKSLRLACHW
ncbi:MAG: type VI secretion system-associated protein VasI [Methylococcaceae bacterium]